MAGPERVVLVTGSSSGLGAALLTHFYDQGWGVVLNYVVEPEAEALYRTLVARAGDDRILKVRANVADRAEVRAMFDRALEKFGRVDALVNCAGINRDAAFQDLTDEAWDSVVSAHLKGTFTCGQEYVLHNTSAPGHIVNLGAACALQGRKNGANFCAAKAGIIALTKCMALELAPRIQVNCLIPGSVNTREVRERYHLDTKEGQEKLLRTIPMGRLGELEDVIRMVECILGSRFTTGENFFVNGGEYMH
jgi:NAD(P)-dependent dehydrogenase (short-subunit alcohol dehydrogenase family)